MKPCPCDSGLTYGQCCEPYITGVRNAPTAEALMRSRYTAYVEQAIDYIMTTCTHNRKETIDPEETRRWSKNSTWLGLTIIATEKGGEDDTEGKVEFEARFEMNGEKDKHHETARFKKKHGRWLYDSGTMTEATVVRAAPKVGRNEPCPCGSGKKHKHCCAK